MSLTVSMRFFQSPLEFVYSMSLCVYFCILTYLFTYCLFVMMLLWLLCVLYVVSPAWFKTLLFQTFVYHHKGSILTKGPQSVLYFVLIISLYGLWKSPMLLELLYQFHQTPHSLVPTGRRIITTPFEKNLTILKKKYVVLLL